MVCKSRYDSTTVKGCRRNKAIINVDVLVEEDETSRKHAEGASVEQLE